MRQAINTSKSADPVEVILYQWGIWSRKDVIPGYTESSLGRLIKRVRRDAGGDASVAGYELTDSQALVIDQCVAQLPAPHMKKAIKLRYVKRLSLREAAQRSGVSYNAFRRQHQYAVGCVKGMISDRADCAGVFLWCIDKIS